MTYTIWNLFIIVLFQHSADTGLPESKDDIKTEPDGAKCTKDNEGSCLTDQEVDIRQCVLCSTYGDGLSEVSSEDSIMESGKRASSINDEGLHNLLVYCHPMSEFTWKFREWNWSGILYCWSWKRDVSTVSAELTRCREGCKPEGKASNLPFTPPLQYFSDLPHPFTPPLQYFSDLPHPFTLLLQYFSLLHFQLPRIFLSASSFHTSIFLRPYVFYPFKDTTHSFQY